MLASSRWVPRTRKWVAWSSKAWTRIELHHSSCRSSPDILCYEMIVLEGLGAKPRSKDLTVTVQGGLRALCSEEAQSSCVCGEGGVRGGGMGRRDGRQWDILPQTKPGYPWQPLHPSCQDASTGLEIPAQTLEWNTWVTASWMGGLGHNT